jgi:L-fucose isomerase-like protein
VEIVVVGFATRLHGESYYEAVYEEFKKHVVEAGLSPRSLPVVTSVEEARRAAQEASGSLPVLVALTGGTSRLIREFAVTGGFQRALILAHGEHNSLASAVSARARLDDEGVYSWVFHCKHPGSRECGAVVERAVKVARAVARLLGSKILLVKETAERGEVEEFEDRFDARVEILPYEDLAGRLKEAPGDLVEHFYRVVERLEFYAPRERERLDHVARLYAVLKDLVVREGYTGIAVDCFPYLLKYKVTPCLALAVLNGEGLPTACEADLASLALMVISRELTGLTGWIANLSAIDESRAYFAHCTIATSMIAGGKVLTHFESSYPYSLSGRLPAGTYTFMSMSRDYSTIIADVGRVTSSGLLSEHMCRTQAIIELDYSLKELPEVAPANHHVIVPGDVRELLKPTATLLGLDYVEYREILKPI